MQKIRYILRPETAQGIFVNFKNVQRTSRKKSAISALHRLENLSVTRLLRVTLLSVPREFEQMELEFFCEPGTDLEWFAVLERRSVINWLLSLLA